MGPDIVNLIFVVLLLAGSLACVLLFIQIQRILADPRRREFNERWFAAFEEHVAQRYDEDGIEWRVRDLHEHWAPGKASPM
ncbi:hypothetical protein IT575_01595 [bacterium]|nr:hypothetical protein [bacterium]